MRRRAHAQRSGRRVRWGVAGCARNPWAHGAARLQLARGLARERAEHTTSEVRSDLRKVRRAVSPRPRSILNDFRSDYGHTSVLYRFESLFFAAENIFKRQETSVTLTTP